MIKIENTEVTGWEAAIRGCRNPKNSWDKSDTWFYDHSDEDGIDHCHSLTVQYATMQDSEQDDVYDVKWTEKKPRSNGDKIIEHIEKVQSHPYNWITGCKAFIGPADHKLLKTLCKGGTEESKWRRFIHVTCDITAPLYWISEFDTYKVGVTRNSCSFMHKGLSKPFEVTDFSIQNPDVYEVLSPIEKEESILKYPYETDDYRIYETENGRQYKVYPNGKIKACAFSYIDSYGKGRSRSFLEQELKPSLKPDGYFEINLGGRSREKWLLHRLIATVWIPNPNNYDTVNHINGDKGDNSIENLEWCPLRENIQKGYDIGLFDKNKLHGTYIKWKNGHHILPEIKHQIKEDHKQGLKGSELAQKYNLPLRYINNILFLNVCEDNDTFMDAYIWEKYIDNLNQIRDVCIETKDNSYFQALRQMLPCGYNQRYTVDLNYEVLAAQYKQRKNHRLDEWRSYCEWIRSLPYSELITMDDEEERKKEADLKAKAILVQLANEGNPDKNFTVNDSMDMLTMAIITGHYPELQEKIKKNFSFDKEE